MTSYRFCRTDDVPLLVEAHNRCYWPDSGERDELTVDRFKRLIRELNLWTSSCMVATAGDDPIAVVLAGKRESENWIYRVAVHPDHRRQGHGRHVLTSLSQKMAILGPPRLLAEVPQADRSLRGFFEVCGYARRTRGEDERELVYRDFRAEPLADAPAPPPILEPVTLSDLAGRLEDRSQRSWCRRADSLANLGDELAGYAVASEQRFEAFALYRDDAPRERREVLAVSGGVPGGSHEAPDLGDALLSMILVQVRRTSPYSVFLPRVEDQEVGFELLQENGFEPGQSYTAMSAIAAPL